MQITDINPTKKGRWSIFVDGEFYGVLHSDIYIKSNLKAGDTIPQPELDELIARSTEAIAREKALTLLAGRSYTSQGLYEKLLAISDEESAERAVRRMQELGLIDDRDYARRYAADCVNLKGFSYMRTRQALRQKGIPRAIIEETMEGMTEEPEVLIARAVLRRYKRYLDTESGRKKVIDALTRRGFFYGDSRSVVENMAQDPEYYADLEENT